MSPQRLALRTLLRARPRSVAAMCVITACLSTLDLCAGHIASSRARLEHQAVVGERLGHLTITRTRNARGDASFDTAEAIRVRQFLEASPGVALVVPQMSVSGIASTGQRSVLFHGEGIGPVVARDVHAPELPGKLTSAQPNGIALSTGQARSLGVRSGSNLTLSAASTRPSAPLSAEIVDIFSTAGFNEGARSLLMPIEMARSLLDTKRTERLVVYLSEPKLLEQQRQRLQEQMRARAMHVDVRTWQELSSGYKKERATSDLLFNCVAAVMLAVIAATVAATVSINGHERRREVATLRALGMRHAGVFRMFTGEALWMASIGVTASVVATSLITWVVNRAALSYTAQHGLKRVTLLVELDFERMLAGVAAVLVVAVLAAVVPAAKAARTDVARGLS